MQRFKSSFDLNRVSISQILNWAEQYDHFTYFNHCGIPYRFDSFPHMLAVGCHDKVSFDGIDDFHQLAKHPLLNKDWLVGYLGYDLKNQLEKLESKNPDRIGNADIYFYQPKHILHFGEQEITIESLDDPNKVIDEIKLIIPDAKPDKNRSFKLRQNTSREEYLKTVSSLQNHILEGDIYEINYCIEFSAQNASIDPAEFYQHLTSISPTPFSVFQKIGAQYLMCASPERFLKKEGSKLISQPIKGTIRRGSNTEEDEQLKDILRHSEKERAENMMIVDLVRNDLARSSKPGSVRVDEIFGIYSFKQVHQMVSTIVSTIKQGCSAVDAIKNAFPMGSMTGAPKIKVMELIDKYERAKRGLYSGAVGFLTPDGDFDFNVVIRSLLYNEASNTLAFQVGSAITYDSVPKQEYEECLLKAQAIMQVLEHARLNTTLSNLL
ncbi:MAG: anthranilate synthase component I family protein [Bacteroidota bacterium]